MTENKDIYKIIERVLLCVLIIFVLGFVWIYADADINHYTVKMNSDIASETLVGISIYENGYTLPDTWCGSTHKYIISTPNLEALLYPVTGYNMNLAMGISCAVMMIALVGVMILYFRQIGLRGAEIFVAAGLALSLMKCGEDIHNMMYLYAEYYVSHLITLFIIMMLYNSCLKKNKVSVPIIVLTVVLAVINGLQGMHACLFCYAPLLGTEILRRFVLFIKKKKQDNFFILGWVFGLFAISFLATKFSGGYGLGASRNIRHAGEKFVEIVLPFLLEVISFDTAPVLAILFCVLAVCGYVMTAISLIKRNDDEDDRAGFNRYSLFTMLFGVIICVLSSTFTTSEAAPRYYLMLVFVVAVGTAAFMNRFNKKYTMWIAVPVIVYMSIKGMYFYDDLIKSDNTKEYGGYLVSEWMSERGYEYGYSTFDHANMITVLSNNKVKIRPVNSMEEMQGAKWLSDKNWYPPGKDAAGATCYIVSKALEQDFEKFIERENPVIEDTGNAGDYTIYVLDKDYTVWVD